MCPQVKMVSFTRLASGQSGQGGNVMWAIQDLNFHRKCASDRVHAQITDFRKTRLDSYNARLERSKPNSVTTPALIGRSTLASLSMSSTSMAFQNRR